MATTLPYYEQKDIENIKNLNQYERLQQKIDCGLSI